jgi:flagella basal body P-ring formation protein FlgA
MPKTPLTGHLSLLLVLLFSAVPGSSELAQADLLAEVAKQLVQRSSEVHDSVQVVFKARATDWPPTGSLLSVEPLSSKLRGTIVVDASLKDGSSIRLTARVRTWDRLWSASRLIKRGEAIFSDMVTIQLVETTRSRQDLIRVDVSPLGLIARRRIGERDLLSSIALESPQAVSAGSDVRLRLQCGPVLIDDVGRALQSGVIGEQILVRSGSTGKVLKGSISPDGVVFCAVE